MNQNPGYSKKSSKWMSYLSYKGTIKDVCGYTKTHIDTLYQLAKVQFSSSQHSKSLITFRYLCLLDHNNYDFFLGLALNQIKLNQLHQAAATFAYATTLNSHDPRASLYMSEIFINLQLHLLAYQSATSACEKAKKSSKWHDEYLKAQQILSALKNSSEDHNNA